MVIRQLVKLSVLCALPECREFALLIMITAINSCIFNNEWVYCKQQPIQLARKSLVDLTLHCDSLSKTKLQNG